MHKIMLTVGLMSLVFFSAGSAQATGLLIPSQPGIPPLGIKYHRAEVDIQDRAAVTKVEQVFVNHTGRPLEATYIFPLPKGGTVSDFYLYVNGKKTKGELLEKNQARNIYEGIVRRMQDPGLLEYLERDLFKCRVFPVPAKGEQRIEITFTHLMPYEGGLVHYSYPMRTDRASSRTIQDFTLSIKIRSKNAIKTIYSPTHTIYHRKNDDHHATAGFETSAALLDRDFDLFYAVSDQEVGLNLLTHREDDQAGFFMLMISPKSEYRDKQITGKHLSLVIDTSGSMAGEKMKSAKLALKHCLEGLLPQDTFSLVRFSTDVESFAKTPQAASKENVSKALSFVDRMEAAGGTAMSEALELALGSVENRSAPKMVVLVTDGYPTVGQTQTEIIEKNVRKANRAGSRLFVFGVGDEINTLLLDSIAADNHGDATYVRPNAQIEQALRAFYDKVSHPVLQDLELSFGSARIYDLMPKKLPDLFKGGQVLLLGRYRNPGHSSIGLSGKMGDRQRKFVYEGVFPSKEIKYDFIPRLWATRKVGFLLESIRLNGEQKELLDEVVALSKRYGIVTPYTSYLVTEDTPQIARRTPPPRARPIMPLEKLRSGYAPSRSDAGRAWEPKSPERAKKQIHMFAEKKSEAMQLESGQQAIQMADAVKSMKDSEEADNEMDEAGGIRYAASRAFRYRSGVWVDLAYRPDMKVLKVKYLGRAYLKLIKKSARLRTIFSLGEKVIVVVGKNRAIEVGPDGLDEIEDRKIDTFLP